MGGNAEYIARSDALDALAYFEEYSPTGKCARDIIRNLPAADVAERKKSRWIVEAGRRNHWHCRECGYVIGVMKMDANFCPSCGAYMTEAE